MTNEEALNDIIESGINLGAGDFVDVDALKVAVKALEKQIPKKPTDTIAVIPIIAENGAYVDADVNVELLCPVCGDQVGFNENCNNYCRNCGQKIDFTEETE